MAALGWGVAIALAGLSDSVWPVLLCLALAGGADQISGIARSTLWNQSIPDALRGRMAGVELLSYSVGPQLGQVRAGGMAGLVGVRASVWVGGVACVVGVLALATALPRLLSYDDRTDPHAAAVRAEHERAAADRAAAERPAERTAGPTPVEESPATMRLAEAGPLPRDYSPAPSCGRSFQCGSFFHSRLRSSAVSSACAASCWVAYGPRRSLAGHSGPSSTLACLMQ